ncbi:MAG: hypothetical protein ACYTGZ_00710 [Planctomycetota bacterium]
MGLLSLVVLSACTGKSSPTTVSLDAIAFETTDIPDAGAGELYNQVIAFATTGNAAMPDRFDLLQGQLPPGVSLIPDREDLDNDGQPDADGALTGNARLLGFPRQDRTGIPYNFVIKAISTGQLATKPQAPGAPALAAEQPFQIEVFQGKINILNPTALEGSNDPAIPAFPKVINFVNPANPQAFFSFPFETAGGTGNNLLTVYMPRELELSVFDQLGSSIPVPPNEDTIEIPPGESDPFKVHFSDGGVFNLQAGNKKIQIGGFQSPRGDLGTIDPLNPEWFQRSPGTGGPGVHSRRDVFNTDGFLNGDTTVAEATVLFSDYFDGLEVQNGIPVRIAPDKYEGTWEGYTHPTKSRRKYPFVAAQYTNAFFESFDVSIHRSELLYNIIVEAIDTAGTSSKVDDIISRKGYTVVVEVPAIAIDTVFIPGGTAGVDYNEFINASGGVPPLLFDLEWVDGVDDGAVTTTANLNKDLFGIDLNEETGGFFGIPRAQGDVDLSVRVHAAVMRSAETGSYEATIPNVKDANDNIIEHVGTHPDTGLTGIHKTFKINFSPPSQPAVLNNGLDPGVDGKAYLPADGQGLAGTGKVVLMGIGGVARMVPYPVDYPGIFPASPARNYAWDTTYDQDSSFTPPATGVAGLPNSLTLDGELLSQTSGQIDGIAHDRGFHPVYVDQTDVFIGNAINPNTGVNVPQNRVTPMALSISPDSAVYLRGLQSTEGTGGSAGGLNDTAAQTAESRMVPQFLDSTLFRSTTGEAPSRIKGPTSAELPPKFDILPVGIPNGGERVNVNKSIATIGGFWPGEAGKETVWDYRGVKAWRHLKQEMTWIQIPDQEQRRVFLWGQTGIKKWSSGATSGMYSRRYQYYLTNGKRGIMIVEPRTADVWVPGIFDNAASDADGSTFGSEFVQSPVSVGYYQPKAPYRTFYYYSTRDYADYDHHGQGLGVYIENLSTSSASGTGWYAYDMGRGSSSVAVSADGVWCATAMPGGDQQKIALWRTDGLDVDDGNSINIDGTTIVGVPGFDEKGDATNKACVILNLGGSTANDNDILPDSLMFVEGGLIFARYTTTGSSSYSMDTIFGFSTKNGAFTSISMNNTTNEYGGNGITVANREGRYIPDQDQIRGPSTSQTCLSQFSWAGNKPAENQTGPNTIAFTGGSMYDVERNNYHGSIDREGFRVEGNRNQALFVLKLDGTGSDGLNLQGGTAKAQIDELTGNSSLVYGDLLTPGRPGEMLDFLKVSGDGKYVAVVRDHTTRDSSSFSFYNRRPTFSNYYQGTSRETAMPSHDVLLFSTSGASLDTTKTAHVLHIGTGNNSNDTTTTPPLASYAAGRSMINAQWRRVHGLDFSEDSTKLFFEYASDESYTANHFGYLYGWNLNPVSSGSWQNQLGTAQLVQFNFRTTSDGPINIGTGTHAVNPMNGLKSVDAKSVGGIGDTTQPFGATEGTSSQNFWARFRSPDGRFLYYVCDNLAGPAHMFGMNMTDKTIKSPNNKDREPYKAFALHPSTIAFEQFEANSFNYESRFAAAAAGTFLGEGVFPARRDASGIVFVVGGDASSGGSPQNDLEVYVFDANWGGELVALTSAITTGTTNAINYLYVSMDANTLIGQRSTTSDSRGSRVTITTKNDIFAVTNVHAALRGDTPNAFIVSKDQSHGASVGLVGEGTSTGAQAVVYSAAPSTGGNTTWDERQLFSSILAPAANRTTLDQAKSHYTVLAAGRKLNDDASGPD